MKLGTTLFALAAAAAIAGLSLSADVALAQSNTGSATHATPPKSKAADPCKQFKADSQEHKDCAAKHAATEKAKKPGTKKP